MDSVPGPRVNRDVAPACAGAPCPRCATVKTMVIPCAGRSGPHDREVVCSGCGRHVAWAPKPRDPEEAKRFEVPFGKFKGRPLGELDDGSLRWLANTCRARSVADRAEVVLRARRAKK